MDDKQSVVNVIEQTLEQMASEAEEKLSLQASLDEPSSLQPSTDESLQANANRDAVEATLDTNVTEWLWIDTFLQQYVEMEAAVVNVTGSNADISYILEYYAMSEQFRYVVINQFATSDKFLNFTTQHYSRIKDNLLQWFVTLEDYRNAVLQHIMECTEINNLLKLFVSSIPVEESKSMKKDSFALGVLEKWSETECFKSALLRKFVIYDRFIFKARQYLSNSEVFAKTVSLEFLGSQRFASTLIDEYTKSEQLLNTLLQKQFKTSQKFHEYLLKYFIHDQVFRENVFKYLSSNDSEPGNTAEFKEIFLQQVVQNKLFRGALFKQFLEAPEFETSALEQFASIEYFQYALIKIFAQSEEFENWKADSQVILNDAIRQFENLESFRHAVMMNVEKTTRNM